jgi:predicted dehydrogenase
MERKIRVGIIGTGFGARVHAPLMIDHPNYEVVSIASVHRGRPDVVRRETGIENVYTNWQEMLEKESLDLVSVASNPFHHHEMVIKAYEHGYHVLCEKPMALDADQSKEMIEARDRAHRMGWINFEFRFLPARLKVKEIIESGKLGRIMHITYKGNSAGYSSFSSRRRGWLGQKESGGGMLGAIGSHMFDSLLWWYDAPVSGITGQLTTHFPKWSGEDGEVEVRTADDAFQVMGTFEDGTTFSTELFFSGKHVAHRWRLEIFGTEGTLVMTDDQKVELGLGDEPLQQLMLDPLRTVPDSIPSTAISYYHPFYSMLTDLYRSLFLQDPQVNIASFEDGHRVQLILDAVRRSAEEGRRIYLLNK